MISKKYLSFLLPALMGFYSSQAQIIRTYAGSGFGAGGAGGYSGDHGPANMAQLNKCTGVAFDGAGNVYIADRDNNVVRKVNTLGIITTFAGTDTPGYSGNGNAAVLARLNHPCSVASDAAGNVYISDNGNNVIRIVSTAGIINTYAGNDTAGYSGDSGPANYASLNNPLGIAVDGTGNLYIADAGNHVVRKVDGAGIISTIAGNGTYGYSGDNGPAVEAQLSNPVDVAVDPYGDVFIADINNNVVRELLDSTGDIVTFAGNGTAGHAGDGGDATNAQLFFPSSVSVDNGGSVYITDQGNNTVRRVDSLGNISVFAGVPLTNGYSGDNGDPTLAHLNSPSDVTADGWGRIYIADYGNNVIRLVTYDGVAGVLPVASKTGVNVYPNPSNGQFVLEVPQTGSNAAISVVDVLGRVVATRNTEETKTRAAMISFSGIADGCYVVKVNSGTNNYFLQVVVSK